MHDNVPNIVKKKGKTIKRQNLWHMIAKKHNNSNVVLILKRKILAPLGISLEMPP
jgi:hypothetical protein